MCDEHVLGFDVAVNNFIGVEEDGTVDYLRKLRRGLVSEANIKEAVYARAVSDRYSVVHG